MNSSPYELINEDYFKLWMYFEDRADNVKEAMFRTLTWTLGFASALLGFIFFTLTNYDRAKAQVPLSVLVMAAAVSGLFICLYSAVMLNEAGKHIQRNWARAGRCQKNVEGLESIIGGDKNNGGKDFKIWHQLFIIVALFALAFLAILALDAVCVLVYAFCILH